jgi:hypothetical protein
MPSRISKTNSFRTKITKEFLIAKAILPHRRQAKSHSITFPIEGKALHERALKLDLDMKLNSSR